MNKPTSEWIAETEFGTVEHNGEKLWLTQQAYVTYGGTYQAAAIDSEGNDYTVTWDTVEGWEQCEDESEACDWSVYTVTKN